MISILNILKYCALTASSYFGILSATSPDNQTSLVLGASSFAIFIFLFLISKQISQSFQESQLVKNAELYNSMGNNLTSESTSLLAARTKALKYCNDLVKDYKKTRQQSQVLYYSLQLSTIIFSGVTPILVLVDKLETGQPWLKWLPVICPAIASIVASIVTSFPFQELSIAANTTVELLEAEQEKFILGVGQSYRSYDATSDNEEQQKSIQAIENFIIEVNNIHLKQVQQQKNQNESSVNSTSESSS